MGAMESPKLTTVSGQANLAHTAPITVSQFALGSH